MHVSDRSCLMKGGFEFIALALLQVLDRPIHLLPLGSADDLMSTCIDSDQTNRAHGTVTWTRQENRHDPEIALTDKPLRVFAQAAERVATNNVGIGGLQHGFRLAVLCAWPSMSGSVLLLLLHLNGPLAANSLASNTVATHNRKSNQWGRASMPVWCPALSEAYQ